MPKTAQVTHCDKEEDDQKKQPDPKHDHTIIWRDNMDAELEVFREFIKGALFVTMDCEFSGIQAKEFDHVKLRKWDTPQERYQRAAASATTYSLLQIGFSVFRWADPEICDELVAKTWTMNLYPQTQFRAFDRRFTSQSSSLAFLAHNDFDFNKLFTMAVPYFSKEDEKECRERHLQHLETKFKRESARANSGKRVKAVKPIDLKFVDDFKVKLDELVKLHSTDPKATVELEAPNKFLRLLIYDTIKHEYPSLKFEKQQSSDPFSHTRPTILVSLLESTREEAEKSYRKDREEEFEQLVFSQKGLNRFIGAISEAGVVVGVHNGLLDFLHVYSCVIAEPAERFVEFRDEFIKYIPRFLDTKYMAFCESQTPGTRMKKGTHLGECMRVTRKWPGVKILGGFGVVQRNAVRKKPKGVKEHDAGYDAFLTGQVLVKFLCKFGAMNPSGGNPAGDVFCHESLQKYLNILHLQFSFTTLPFDPKEELLWRKDMGDIICLDMAEHVDISTMEEIFNTYIPPEGTISTVLYRSIEEDQKAFVKLPGLPLKRLKEIGIDVAINQIPEVLKIWLYMDAVDAGEENEEIVFWRRHPLPAHKEPPPLLATTTASG